MFTGDRSGDWLFDALHHAGFASQPTSVHRDDGLRLRDAYITATIRCAPPANKPLPAETERCEPYLLEELAPPGSHPGGGGARPDRLARIFAGPEAAGAAAVEHDAPLRARLGHGVCGRRDAAGLLPSSQQNTFTGKLTRPMLRGIFERARDLLSAPIGAQR